MMEKKRTPEEAKEWQQLVEPGCKAKKQKQLLQFFERRRLETEPGRGGSFFFPGMEQKQGCRVGSLEEDCG